MRVTIVNFCSTALDMLEFSTHEALANAGGEADYDYLCVTWNPTPEVEAWLDGRPSFYRSRYETRQDLDYVPNLRAMMSQGFDAGYALNDYVAIINTDMAFGRDWLVNLARRAEPDVIPNSVHVTPIASPFMVKADFGIPAFETFQQEAWWECHDRLLRQAGEASRRSGRDCVQTVQDRGGDWRSCATFPYVIHRKWWERFGPWEPNLDGKSEAPDRRFFGRCVHGGAKLILCLDSVCYHHEAVERRGKTRPVGVESMKAGL
jgi:hypothetical protein